MKISGPGLPPPPSAVQRVSTAGAREMSSSVPPSPKSLEAGVVVSASAGSASAAQARSDHEIDQRIEVLRTSIAAGEYKPDLDKLAQRFVDEERQRVAGNGHEPR
jgi:flagellar biosynthesis anti-sigma factor FlgM